MYGERRLASRRCRKDDGRGDKERKSVRIKDGGRRDDGGSGGLRLSPVGGVFVELSSHLTWHGRCLRWHLITFETPGTGLGHAQSHLEAPCEGLMGRGEGMYGTRQRGVEQHNEGDWIRRWLCKQGEHLVEGEERMGRVWQSWATNNCPRRSKGVKASLTRSRRVGGHHLPRWWPQLAFFDARLIHQSYRGGTMTFPVQLRGCATCFPSSPHSKPAPSTFKPSSMEPRVTRSRKAPLTQAVPDPPKLRPKRKATESSNAAADPSAAKTAVKKSKSKTQITAPDPPAIKKSKSKAPATEKAAEVPVDAADGGSDADESPAPSRPKAHPRPKATGAVDDLATDPFDLSSRRRAISKKSDQEPVPADKADETSTNAPASADEDVDDAPPIFYSKSRLWSDLTVLQAMAQMEANPMVAAEMSWPAPSAPPAPLAAPQFVHLVDIARRPSLFPPRQDGSRLGLSPRATTSHSSPHNDSPQFRPAPHSTTPDSLPNDPEAEVGEGPTNHDELDDFPDIRGGGRDDAEEDDFLDILGGGSNDHNDDARFPDAQGGGHDDESDNEGSVVSSYSTTAAATRKEDARHNKIAIQSTHAPLFVAQEDLDAEDMAQYTAEFSKKAKGKGKQKAVTESVAGSDGELDANDKDEDSDSEPPPATEWDLIPGPLSNEDREAALTARHVYHATIATIAQRSGKRVSAVFKAVGDQTSTVRRTNSWNAFQTKFRAENKKSPDVTKEVYEELMRAAYDDLFSSLSEEEKKDPAAWKECVQELMAWYESNSMALLDDRKADGRGPALMSKIIQPFIHQSTVTSNNYDVEVFGFGIDPVSDVAIVWGGMPAFHAVYDKYKIPIKATLNDMKAMLQFPGLYEWPREERPPHNRSLSTSPRSQQRAIGMCLNDIHLIIGARGDPALKAPAKMSWKKWSDTAVKLKLHLIIGARGDPALKAPAKMSWKKWSDTAVKLKLRIENWPAALKANFPSEGFELGHIAGQQENTAFKEMRDKMKIRYEGGEDAGMKIVSWTEDECELEDLADISDVPVVVCEDATTLSFGKSSKALLRKMGVADDAASAAHHL
ncbi:hypothetical protein DFH09DRAFT_1097504 [Mycena vulgaris]|nr:hypothetical protein DFH09DRAFT_1097504 [Mycena vulgaris]